MLLALLLFVAVWSGSSGSTVVGAVALVALVGAGLGAIATALLGAARALKRGNSATPIYVALGVQIGVLGPILLGALGFGLSNGLIRTYWIALAAVVTATTITLITTTVARVLGSSAAE